MDSELRKHFVGPMPVRDFFNTFLPVEVSETTRNELPSFTGMARLKLENKKYRKFARPYSLFHYPMFLII
jgi:hypothetical protein